MLNILTDIPNAFLTVDATKLHSVLNGPTLFHLEGRHKEPLFVSTLLHGNETTGLQAIQKLLIKYKEQTLPRSFSFFIGNVQAAQKKLRRLELQPDYNRTWPYDATNKRRNAPSPCFCQHRRPQQHRLKPALRLH